jgi:hypothetical protein
MFGLQQFLERILAAMGQDIVEVIPGLREDGVDGLEELLLQILQFPVELRL